MQKTFYGLVRSLLFQILSKAPDLCDEIPQHCLPKDKGLRIKWTLSDLQDTLHAVFRQQRQELSVCLFIDALDEFDGHLESLSEFIQSMVMPRDSTKFRAKVFFSSRPRDILFDQFKHFPSFQLQEYTKDDIERYTIERLRGFPGVLNQMELSQAARQTISRVVGYINQTANGVFLWVRLALDKLSEAFNTQEALTALDMNQLLRELPTELGDFYAAIIDRMPQDFRWNAYLVLDTLLKAFDEPSLQDLHLIVVNSKCQTIQECESRQSKPQSFQNFCTQLREQCGGLVELEEPFQEDGRVRLMHQTVREFVSQPAFQELIVGREALFRPQNGYTELAKLQHCKDPIDLMIIRGTPRYHLPVATVYLYLAEITTGTCQLRFIDSLGGRFLLISYLPDDPLTFAVYYGLSLFVLEKLSKFEESKPCADKALLHAVCLAANRFEAASVEHECLNRYHIEYKPDYIRIAQLLIRKGLRITPYKGTQPLGVLLYFPSQLIDSTAYLHRSPGIMEMAQLLLANGQDPNASSVILGRQDVTSSICRPLHISLSPVTEFLLRNGADINRKDEKGRTPLDMMIRRIMKDPKLEGSAYILTIPNDLDSQRFTAARTINVLIEKGGLITRVGLMHLLECQSRLSSWKPAPHILEMIQKSLKEGTISLAEFWMARIAARIRKSKRSGQGKDWQRSLRQEEDYF